jgi:hypothetical protein
MAEAKKRGRPRKTAAGGGFGAMADSAGEAFKKKTMRKKRTKAAEPAKRGRGRPKGASKKTGDKNFAALVSANSPAKRGRGRPKKAASSAPVHHEAPAAKKRGRPAGSTKAAKTAAAKKTAHKSKVVKHAKLWKEAGAVNTKTKKAVGVKGRGRPAKAAPKAGRGRPKGSTKAAATAKKARVKKLSYFGGLFKDLGKGKRNSKGKVVPAGVKRGRPAGSGQPKNAAGLSPMNSFTVMPGVKRGRGRPKGSKDKTARKKRSGGLMMNTSTPHMQNISGKMQKPKMVVHMTPTNKMGKVVGNGMGKMRTAR